MSSLPGGAYVGRARLPGQPHPAVVTVRDGMLVDITNRTAPTVRDVCELDDPPGYVAAVDGRQICPIEVVLERPWTVDSDAGKPRLLAPVDLQAIKAAGVTFVASLLERVIEEQARGQADKAEELRAEITELIGTDLSELLPGSEAADAVKNALITKGIWSQYLEVGIGLDAEIFTKAQPMSTVGSGADVGLHPMSIWNNPEPEIALVVSSGARVLGATLGNDVNLRDVEGRSALLLGKAKDNNASASLGPFVRLFDRDFTLESIKSAEVRLSLIGEDGFEMQGVSSMREISRSPESLVEATIGPHHQYPDGLVLYLGTMFAPVADRDRPGEGFTHKDKDIVCISTPTLGMLENRVRLCTDCEPWTYGTRHLLGDLCKAGLI